MTKRLPSFSSLPWLIALLFLAQACFQKEKTEALLYKKQPLTTFFPEENPITVGCYYYPEQWPEKEWDRDLRTMDSIGFEFTHFGEFAWAMMEPTEGNFDFSWLDKAIALADKNHLKVILCTPTPTPPAWLSEKHPEILMQNEDGKIMQHGSRQHASWSSKTYQEYSANVVTALAKKYGQDKRVWGWQLDNEPSHYGYPYDYSNSALQAFRKWLIQKYVSIDSLNNRWGNNFWSQRYNSFQQILLPNQKNLVQPVNPHASLDFQEFTNQERGNFLSIQTGILRQHCAANQFITTNYFMQLPHIDPWLNQASLDFASYTNYPVNSYSEVDNGPLGFRLGSGRDLSMTHEFYQSVNGCTGIMELQPGQVNWGRYNAQPLPGAIRMWIMHCFGLGAKFICTYRYRQPLYGNEQYHQGIMQTDGVTLSRGGKEYLQAIAELNQLKKIYNPSSTTSKKIGIIWDQRSMLDLQNFPHNNQWNAVAELSKYYEILKSFGLPVEFIPSSQPLNPREFSLVLVPSVQLTDESMISRWKEYTSNGGTLIMTVRTGQKNRDGHWWKTKIQEKIYPLIGTSIEFNDHMPPGKNGLLEFNSKSYEWNTWAEILTLSNETNTAEIIATHSDQFYKGKGVAIKNKIAKGTILYIGASSIDGSFEKDIIASTMSTLNTTIRSTPKNVFITKRGNLTVAVNYSSLPYEILLTPQEELVLGNKLLHPGEVSCWKNK